MGDERSCAFLFRVANANDFAADADTVAWSGQSKEYVSIFAPKGLTDDLLLLSCVWSPSFGPMIYLRTHLSPEF